MANTFTGIADLLFVCGDDLDSDKWNRRAQPAEAEVAGEWEWLKLAAEVAEEDGPWEPRLGMTDCETAFAQSASPTRVLELIAALSAVTAERDGEAESCEQWRALALQFDRHRMSALAHLKMVVAGQEGALDACRDFLAAPPVPGHEITAEIDQLRAEVEALRKAVEPLEPVHGDALPPIGSKVLIHLSSSDAWVEHTVAGYYARGALNGDVSLHRVFVRVRDSDGYLNARLLKDVRTVANSTNG